jgi:diphthine synthase
VAELFFVGLGLGDERDLTERARALLASCERVFAEEYTSALAPGSLERLALGLGRPVERLSRADVEAERPILDALERSNRVGFVTAGDPFFATTHVALRLSVERAGHAWRYLPAASVGVSAAGFLGLSLYRFGRVVSIPFPAPGFEPRSPLEGIRSNTSANLHTLVLLDLDPARDRYLGADEALEILRARDDADAPVLPDERAAAVVARVGREDVRAWVAPVGTLRGRKYGPPLHTIVILAPELRELEPEALARFRIAE